MSEIEPLNEELSAKVFNNPVILRKILLHSEFVPYYRFRLVNKIFNDTCIRLNVKIGRKMNFEFNDNTEDFKHLKDKYVHLNLDPVEMSRLAGFFRFLNEVCKVKVEEIRVKNVWKPKPVVAKEFHDSIHKILIGNNRKSVRTLVGLEEVCNGCEDCLNIAQNSKVYGPIGFEIISKIQHHFDELIITDRLLEQIANHCVLDSSTKKECYEKLNTVINSSISCDTLSLGVSETRRIKGQRVLEQFSMPREILDLMVRKWNGKSGKINFIRSFKTDFVEDGWCNTDYFTRFRFNDPFETVEKISEKKEKKLQKIIVDLTDSYSCQQDFRFIIPPKMGFFGYDNLIANIQRIFSTDHIDIKFLSLFGVTIENIQTILGNIIRISRMDNPLNLTINIDFFIQIKYWEWVFEGSKQIVPLEIPKEYIIQPDHLNCIHRERDQNDHDWNLAFIKLKINKWVGRQFTITDNNFRLNLNIFVGAFLYKIPDNLSQIVPFFELFNTELLF